VTQLSPLSPCFKTKWGDPVNFEGEVTELRTHSGVSYPFCICSLPPPPETRLLAWYVGVQRWMIHFSGRFSFSHPLSPAPPQRTNHPKRHYSLASPSFSLHGPLSVLSVHIRVISKFVRRARITVQATTFVDLVGSIGRFVGRLNVYTRVPPAGAVAETIAKIMVELLSTLALATKQIKQKEPSKSTLSDSPLD